MNDKEPNTKIFMAGGIGIVLTALLERGAKTSLKNAIDTYNREIKQDKIAYH